MIEEESNIEQLRKGKSIFKNANFSEQQLVNIEQRLIQSYFLLFFNSIMLGIIALAVIIIAFNL